ncbi:MAG: 50S ribosomal protein L18 [Bacteroidales bacterium]|nr:50S ribosomal protein L18 [Bacteroidales bacterium]
MATKNFKEFRRNRIKMRIRKVIKGTPEQPRLTVFRSNKQIYAQVIDDAAGQTLISASSRAATIADKKVNKIDQASLVGELVATKAIEAGINTVVFDRNGYLYHGRVKSLAEAARKAGLKF